MDQDPKNKPGGASNNYNIAIVSVKSSPSHVYMIKGKNAALDPRAHRPLIAILVVISLPASSSFVGTKAWMGTRNLPGFWGMPLAKQETQQVGSSLEFSRKRRSPFSTGPCMNFDNDLASLQEGKESLSPDYATHIPMPSTAGNAANSRGFVGGCKAGSEPTFNDVLLAKERLKGNVKMTVCAALLLPQPLAPTSPSPISSNFPHLFHLLFSHFPFSLSYLMRRIAPSTRGSARRLASISTLKRCALRPSFS